MSVHSILIAWIHICSLSITTASLGRLILCAIPRCSRTLHSTFLVCSYRYPGSNFRLFQPCCLQQYDGKLRGISGHVRDHGVYSYHHLCHGWFEDASATGLRKRKNGGDMAGRRTWGSHVPSELGLRTFIFRLAR